MQLYCFDIALCSYTVLILLCAAILFMILLCAAILLMILLCAAILFMILLCAAILLIFLQLQSGSKNLHGCCAPLQNCAKGLPIFCSLFLPIPLLLLHCDMELEALNKLQVYPIPALTIWTANVATANFTECIIVSVLGLLINKNSLYFEKRKKKLKLCWFPFLLVMSVFADADILRLLLPAKQHSKHATRKYPHPIWKT